jgi:nucleoside-diphosphate-sugar epimerase
MRVLIRGGAGFVGSHHARALIARGERVRVLDALIPQGQLRTSCYIPARSMPSRMSCQHALLSEFRALSHGRLMVGQIRAMSRELRTTQARRENADGRSLIQLGM